MQTNKNIKNSFSKQANTYQKNAFIQAFIASKLLQSLQINPISSLIDIGCGGGNLALQIEKSNIYIKNFVGIDISKEMLDIHPKKIKNIENITLVCEDFEKYKFEKYDIAIATSSLQWAKDLNSIFKKLSRSALKVGFGIHTSNTLKSLHHFLGTQSPLRNEKILREKINQYFDGKIWLETLEVQFDSREDFLKHIKFCGLLGGGGLSYAQAKNFKKNVPYEKIEYEVLMFIGTPKLISC